MTTPEQLQAWRTKFESAYPAKDLGFIDSGEYRLRYIESEWQGYLRRCQETEQAIKDARKQAWEELLKLAEDHRLDDDGSEYHRGWRNASIRFAKLIERLLK